MGYDHLQHGMGPYRLIDLGDGRGPTPYVVGLYDRWTGMALPPNDGFGYLVDDPVLGTVSYDANNIRIVSKSQERTP